VCYIYCNQEEKSCSIAIIHIENCNAIDHLHKHTISHLNFQNWPISHDTQTINKKIVEIHYHTSSFTHSELTSKYGLLPAQTTTISFCLLGSHISSKSCCKPIASQRFLKNGYYSYANIANLVSLLRSLLIDLQ
jgi:hypothetical protein